MMSISHKPKVMTDPVTLPIGHVRGVSSMSTRASNSSRMSFSECGDVTNEVIGTPLSALDLIRKHYPSLAHFLYRPWEDFDDLM